MNRLGLIKTNYENTYVFPPPPTYVTLQFGGTGNDQLFDVKVSSTGDYVVLGRSSSSSLDGNANPNADSWFVAVLDPLLPPSGFIKDIRWEDAATLSMGQCGRGYTFEIDSDVVYYAMGTYSTGMTTDWVVKRVALSDLTTAVSSATWQTQYGSNRIQIRSGKIYVACLWDSSHADVRRYDGTTMAFETSMNNYGGGQCIRDMVYAGTSWFLVHGGFVGTYPSITSIYGDLSGNGGAGEVLGASVGLRLCRYSSILWGLTLVTDGSFLYISGDNYYPAGGQDWTVFLKYTIANKPVYSAHQQTLNGLYTMGGCSVIGGNVTLFGYSRDAGKVGANDMIRLTRQCSDMSVVATNDWARYNDGSQIGEALKNYISTATPQLYDTGKYVGCGYTDGDLVGFTNAGSNDCIIWKMDLTGTVLP